MTLTFFGNFELIIDERFFILHAARYNENMELLRCTTC